MSESKLPEDLTFETALKELEEITRRLEDGRDSLEDSIELYEKGVQLRDFCNKKLKEAEGKWKALRTDPAGNESSEDMPGFEIARAADGD